jgi:uncharacterized protein
MRYFALIEVCGPSWDDARSRRDQDKWPEHAAFMDALVDEGVVVLGGPLGDEGRVMLIFNVQHEDEIKRRLTDDPWIQMGVLSVASVEPWEILLGH